MTEIILYTSDLNAAITEIENNGGRVIHSLSRRVVIASFVDINVLDILVYSSKEVPENIDEISTYAVESWTNSNTSEKETIHLDGVTWDKAGKRQTPEIFNPNFKPIEGAFIHNKKPRYQTAPKTQVMIGSISVGLVIVSSTIPKYRIDTNEQRLILQQVQKGLNFLVNAEPRAKVSFHQDPHILEVSAKPNYINKEAFEAAEAPWRNEALSIMGYDGSLQGSYNYVNDLSTNTGSGYVAYITKYPLAHFGYAYKDRVVINYYCGEQLGPKNIHRVFAHETCHIFGALDEYRPCNCTKGGIKNYNCVSCRGREKFPCLMKDNALSLCKWTRHQIGWTEEMFEQSEPFA